MYKFRKPISQPLLPPPFRLGTLFKLLAKLHLFQHLLIKLQFDLDHPAEYILYIDTILGRSLHEFAVELLRQLFPLFNSDLSVS